jgi:hypothetical protein
MGADWYHPFTIFGYLLVVPQGTTYAKFVNTIWGLNGALKEPFEIVGILNSFHSRMEGCGPHDIEEFNDNAIIVLGFRPSNDIQKTLALGQELAEYIIDNPILDGIDIAKNAGFYTGIDWTLHIELEEESDDEEDEEDYDSEEEDDEEEDDDDITSSDEDEHKIAPEPVKAKSD